MTFRDIIEAQKHGPEFTFSVICSTFVLGLLNYYQKITDVQTALFSIPLTVLLWLIYSKLTKDITWLNLKWLNFVKKNFPEIILKTHSFKRHDKYVEFYIELSITNTGFKDIENYRALLFIPRNMFLENESLNCEDKSRSNSSEFCLKLSHIRNNTKVVILDGNTERLSIRVVVKDNQVDNIFLKQNIRSSVTIEGLHVFEQTKLVEELLQITYEQQTVIKGIKAA